MGLLDGLLREPAGSALGRGQAGVSSDQVGALIKSVLDSLGGASSTAPPPAAAKAAAPRTYTVLAGDNLSKIAKKFYGDANKWKKIFEANKDTIKNPDLIKIGQVLRVPE